MSDPVALATKVFPFFRFNKGVIDFYLSNFIFPKDVKMFPIKLVSHGWDLVPNRPHLTTGISGTNDNKYLLPTTTSQLELPAQAHTDALVLLNILLPENDNVTKVHHEDKRLDSRSLLHHLHPEVSKVQVLLDVVLRFSK